MRPSSFALPRVIPAVVAVALSAPGCANFAQINKLRAEAHAKEMAIETDPDLRAWLQGWYECNTITTQSYASSVKRTKCLEDSQDKVVAALRASGESATTPGAKRAYERAATCITGAPRPFNQNRYGDYAPVKACLEEKKRFVAGEARAEDDAYATAEKAGAVDAWFDFIARHGNHRRLPEAVKHVLAASLRAEGDARTAIEEKLAVVYPAAVADLPADRRILLVGPKGMRVRDLVKLRDAKVSASLVVARVRASAEPYKNFDGDELAALQQLRISDDVIAAMIEVTTKLAERKKADDERQALRAEIAALRAMIEEKKASGGGKGGQAVQTKEGPMDVLESCAKRLGAMKLCEQIPFPGSTLCKGTAASSFPCPGT